MTSRNHNNPPGLSSLQYRVGVHPTFLGRMLERLRSETLCTPDGQKLRPLANLRIRDKQDPAIALLDSWAMVLDVLSFYQERIANEGYLRTAVERRSVMELVRAVGYELSQGVASGAFLVFRVDDTPGSFSQVQIPRCARVMAVPNQQSALPLVFETKCDFVARREWNDIATCTLAPPFEKISLRERSVEGAEAVAMPDWGWGRTELPSDDEILAKDDSGLSPATVKHQIKIFKAVANRESDANPPGSSFSPGSSGNESALNPGSAKPPTESSSVAVNPGLDSTGSRESPPRPIQAGSSAKDKPLTVQSALHRLDGVNTELRKGDLILVIGPANQWYVSRVEAVDAVHSKNYTSVQWAVPVGCRKMPTNAEVHSFKRRISLFGHSAVDWNGLANREKLEQIVGRRGNTAAFYGGRLLVGVSEGRVYSNSGGSKWTLFAELSTKASVTAIASYKKPVPALSLVMASFVRPFSGLLFLAPGRQPKYLGEGKDDLLRIALVNALRTINIGGQSVQQLLSARSSRFPHSWRWQWLGRLDSRYSSWARAWQFEIHELAYVFDAIIQCSVMSGGTEDPDAGYSISPGSALDRLRSLVSSFENESSLGRSLKGLFDVFEGSMGPGSLAVGTAGDGVFFSEDHGKTWRQNNDGLPDAAIRGLAYDANGNLFARTKDDTFLLLQGDKSWETPKSVTVYDKGKTDGKPYTGKQVTLGVGRYTNLKDELKIAAIDSMKISKGLKVTLNDLDESKAVKRTEVFTGNTPSVGTMNNRIDELIIEKISAGVQFSDDPDELTRLLGNRLPEEWPDFCLRDDGIIDLDGDYPDILPDSWVALVRDEETPALVRVTEATTVFRRDFGVSGKVTRLKIAIAPDLFPERFSLRDTVVFACSERHAAARVVSSSESLSGGSQSIIRVHEGALGQVGALDQEVAEALRQLDGKEGNLESEVASLFGDLEWRRWVSTAPGLTLSGRGLRLEPGQLLSASGLDRTGNRQGEILIVDDVIERESTTVVILKAPIQKTYRLGTLSINANVIPATHGETIADDILGSGDATKSGQRFMLKRGPLTYTSIDSNSLELRVNGVQWHEIDSLFFADETSKNYMLRFDELGNAWAIFGDGRHGARLPTGVENVVATYRVGSGLAGTPPANSLVLPVGMPMGIRSVDNPEAGTGGADAEDHDRARARLPRREAPHDRIISLADNENFASTFPGVAKAQCHRLMIDGRALVHITLAADGGVEIPDTSKLATTLLEAIRQRTVFGQRTRIQSFRPRHFGLEADIYVDPDNARSGVEIKARAALLEAFSFERAEFGRGVAESDVVTIIQHVEGVQYTFFKGFFVDGARVSGPLFPVKAVWNDESQQVTPAELLFIKPEGCPLVLNLVIRSDIQRSAR